MNTATGVLIIGAGFSGLGTAIRLSHAGITDFVICERAADVGGTWRDNTYPGAACDIPSLVYSYSFVPNPNWSRAYSGGAEILAHLRHMADQFGLREHIRFGTDITGLTYDDDTATWTASTQDGRTFTARAVVSAVGGLANASYPGIDGIGTFRGHTMLSSAWDHGYDFTGKHVAVVGTGASAVQIVPELVATAANVKVFQRTPGWVLPKANPRHPSWMTGLFRKVPGAQTALRQALFYGHEAMATGLVWDSAVTTLLQQISRLYLRRAVSDPWLRRRLTPDYRMGCKRVLITSDYYPALQAANCKLITWPIYAISANGIRTAEGIEHEVDCIVFATGFDVCNAGTPFPITGCGGRVLADEWLSGAKAYKSVAVAGYPNLFFTLGPNSGPGHNSLLVYSEAQINYIVQAIALIKRDGLRSLEVRKDVQEEFNRDLQRRLARTTWNSGCRSWYLTGDGFNATMYPGFATQYARDLAELDPDDYLATAG
ncbi:flavin-containing monooxygenase [Kibdelosporangium phytohabitans]|uniref:4-hydroxyacetophenone monooxygenase n=1 Tax=Kibdelosporangium phytohabitans TaxID=860235 RepID=A0A0N9I336_9PSEU|nr:NAD(P)/FAD-dependent oxidoreductase [Kibdelosporangium phytohabitans]ALG08912.1 4-hydroxyacetophenone monooxygenase [Kibdelosporangium phytohabitans]MBE1469929.1 cation diffusion facilitator CzcD-associated flavoprotein CzcO [Kibdelosporangium phytohabitans]